MKKQLTALWEELQERRKAVLKAYDESDSALGKQMFTILANEQATIMDAIHDILLKH